MMRWAPVLLMVLLAGCSSSPAPQGAEAPLAGTPGAADAGGGSPSTAEDEEARREKPKFTMHEAGSMADGVDKQWTFDLGVNATRITIQISAVAVDGMRLLSGLTAEARHNGTPAARYQSGISFCTCDARLIDIQESEPFRGNLAGYAGTWELRLQGDRQWADYDMAVTVVY